MTDKNTVSGVVQEEDSAPDLQSIVPSMNVELPAKADPDANKEIISDGALLGIYDNILGKIKDDNTEIDSVLAKFVDMVINEGDSSTSSKEAMVNLLKMKVDQSDKMAKIADLMTRVKLKDRLTPGGPWLNASQTNNINIGESGQKRAILEAIQKAKKDKK